jgi:Carboxypeptidase regulatory-like domain
MRYRDLRRSLGISCAVIFLICRCVITGAAQIGGVVGGIPGGISPPSNPTAVRDAAPSDDSGTGVIRGRVVAADNGNALRRAQVRINSATGRMMQTAITDNDGRYEFGNLTEGRYFLTVSRNGYVTLQYGQQRPFEGGKPLELSKSQVAEKVDFLLPRGGVIAGRITDDAGEPAPGLRLQAMRYQYNPNGRRQMIPANVGMNSYGFPPTTDDLGQFRIYGLMPGSYVVSASGPMGAFSSGMNPGNVTSNSSTRNEGLVTTYYPGTANPDEAQLVTLGIAQETSIYFPMVSMRMSRVTGVVRDSRGRPAAGLMLSIRTTMGGGFTTGLGGGQTEPNGTFRIENVPPGEHVIEVRSRPSPPARSNDATTPAVEPEFAMVPISLNGQDLTNLVITTGPGATVSGRVVFQGTRPIERRVASGPGAIRVMAQPVEPGTQMYFGDPNENGTVDDEGRFQVRGVSGRVFFRPISVPSGWSLKSVGANGTDITDTPLDVRSSLTGLEVVLTDQQTSVTVTVKNARGETAKDYMFAIFPYALREGISPQRFIRTGRPDQNGQLKVQGLPPGDYFAIAAESLEPGIIYDPAYQQAVRPRSRAVRLNEGQSVALELDLLQ